MKNYDPLKIFVQYWLDEDTNEQKSGKVLIDFEDVKNCEQYVGRLIQPDRDFELTIINYHYDGQYVVEAEFDVVCNLIKFARQFSYLNKLQFFKN